MIRFLKELYLAEFTAFFKAWSNSRWSSSWKPSLSLKAGIGVAGVSLLIALTLIGISMWIEIIMGKRVIVPHISKLTVWIASLVVYLANYYALVIRGHGIRFEREFNNLEKSKQIFWRVGCWVMELATLIFFIYSGYAYQHFFHIVPKSGW